ncbi:MAG: hypothetical protein AAFR14_11785, partial [Bacteroidota bacterium]
IELNPDPTLDPNVGPCLQITAGETLSFTRGAVGCDVVFINEGLVTEVFRTTDQTFSFTFTTVGKFIAFCDTAPLTGPGAVAIAATCIDVSPAPIEEPIPTLGEWGIIIALLLLLIVGVVALRNYVGGTARV